jgi:hypothetical protein
MQLHGRQQLLVPEPHREILTDFLINVDYLVDFELGGDVRQLHLGGYFVLDLADQCIEED